MAIGRRRCRLGRWFAGICGGGIWEYRIAAARNFSRIDPFGLDWRGDMVRQVRPLQKQQQRQRLAV